MSIKSDKALEEVMREHDERYERFLADKNDLRVTIRFRQDNIAITCRSYARKRFQEFEIQADDELLPIGKAILRKYVKSLTDKEPTKGSAN